MALVQSQWRQKEVGAQIRKYVFFLHMNRRRVDIGSGQHPSDLYTAGIKKRGPIVLRSTVDRSARTFKQNVIYKQPDLCQLKPMPRFARLEAPGILHHVIGRGIERKKIFYNDTDRSDFIDRLAALAEEGAMDVHAWVLMPNHYHILCRTRNRPLYHLM